MRGRSDRILRSRLREPPELVAEGASHLCIESRGTAGDLKDRVVLLDALNPHGGSSTMSYDWREKDEPLLWLADAVCGAVADFLLQTAGKRELPPTRSPPGALAVGAHAPVLRLLLGRLERSQSLAPSYAGAMYDHVSLAVADLAASTRFYTAFLGREPGHVADDFVEWADLDLFRTGADRPVTTGLHVALAMPSTDAVDAACRRGRDAGAPDDGAPGPRPAYGPTYYGGFLRDPDGNSAEAVWREELRRGGDIDHLWVRVRDPDASAAFYDAIAPLTGLRRIEHEPGAFVHYAMADGGLLRLLAGAPTTPFHLAFAASDRATVDAFWARATAAGHRDNGGPGERPEYHPGYYGAFVLDPDGHNVESVFHDR